jgi:hypothetical protein
VNEIVEKSPILTLYPLGVFDEDVQYRQNKEHLCGLLLQHFGKDFHTLPIG